MTRKRGFNEQELFLNKPTEKCDSPTVEPLRIFKPQSPKLAQQSQYPRPASENPSPERFAYPRPGSSSSSSSKKPSFPLPPGASSSANPLPYPEDYDKRSVSHPHQSHSPCLPEDSRHFSGSALKPYSTPTPPAPKLYASPILPGVPDFNDTSPHLNTSPTSRRPGLAERRGNYPQPLSPVSPEKEKEKEKEGEEGLFAKTPRDPRKQHSATAAASSSNRGTAVGELYPKYAKPYYPPLGGVSESDSSHAQRLSKDMDSLKLPVDGGVNRFGSTASTSTTRATRGSPPPPETPVTELSGIPGSDIEARYAAAGISGNATLNNFSAAATQRLAQYGGAPPQPSQAPQAPRPWTPTESPDQQPHGPPTVYQGNSVVTSPSPPLQSIVDIPHVSDQQAQTNGSSNLQVSVLEQDFQRMGTKTPPPAYSSLNPSNKAGNLNEKQRPTAGMASSTSEVTGAHPIASASHGHPTLATSAESVSISTALTPTVAPPMVAQPSNPAILTRTEATESSPQKQQLAPQPVNSPGLTPVGHPAFANDPKSDQNVVDASMTHTSSVFQGTTGPKSPPPLPEGWIAHLDQNSGQYYYIHIATSATQWEFPKGPNPIHHEPAPLSPTASTYGNPLASPLFSKQNMASPMFPPTTPGYAESIMTVAASATPSAAGFTGPPPTAGVDNFRINPSNGVYFGPYLRYGNMDIEKSTWLGSILIVSDAPQPPTIHIHLSVDLSPNPRELTPHPIYTHQRWTFYKYVVDLAMAESTERWTYAVTSHLGCTRYEFVVAGRQEMGWRFLAHSGNDFAPVTNKNERAKLGDVGFMWKDVLQKNVECGGFHIQLGLGGQIYGDRLWQEVPLLRQWLATSGKENRKNAGWTARHEEDVSHAYFHYYTSHFDQAYLREAFAQIPHILQVDDHDM